MEGSSFSRMGMTVMWSGGFEGRDRMDLGLRGRKALVTGASKGIGRACAEVLAEEGCDIVLVSRTADDLEAVRAKIVGQHNVAVRYYPLDLSDSRHSDQLADECADPELLVNSPEEIGWMAAFLASDRSAYTTGSIVTIDGGGSSRRSAL